jgi:hypothetical protein
MENILAFSWEECLLHFAGSENPIYGLSKWGANDWFGMTLGTE